MAVKRWLACAALVTCVIAAGGPGDRLHACGPFAEQIILTNPVYPSDWAAYVRGDIGVVQPRHARFYLVMAYRRLTGIAAPGLPDDPGVNWPDLTGRSVFDQASKDPQDPPAKRWADAIATSSPSETPSAHEADSQRLTADRSFYVVCNDDAFRNAIETLSTRARAFGRESPGVRDWISGQRAVFANCDGSRTTLSLPGQIPEGLPPVFRADRSYQTAAAYFYGGDYEKAEALFREISDDGKSPWQPKGRYLAARALIRRALLSEHDPKVTESLLLKAEADLNAILDDAAQNPMHAASRSLRDWVFVHVHPEIRLRSAADELTTLVHPAPQSYIDFGMLADRLINPGVSYDYGKVSAAVAHSSDLADWITAMQGGGADARARALAQWQSKQTLPWLVAALWRVDAKSPDVSALLSAAASVPATSPAYATATFLRARLLNSRNEFGAVREMLATMPRRPVPGFPAEAINLLKSQRFRAASSLDDALQFVPRTPVASGAWLSFTDGPSPDRPYSDDAFDADAAIMFSEQLPLSRLVEAASSERLPSRLRLKVAIAAWTRAVELRNDAAGLSMARVLGSLSPSFAPDLEAYVRAGASDRRHHVAVLLLLRWAGMRNYVPLAEEVDTYRNPEPRRGIGFDSIKTNWWCGFTASRLHPPGPYGWSRERPVTTLPDFDNRLEQVEPAAFLSAAERAATASELRRLATLGSGPTYLATEAISWANASPRDNDVAEALALAVNSGHYGCGDDATTKGSRTAFTLLHKLYPASAWAKQTPYWYEGR